MGSVLNASQDRTAVGDVGQGSTASEKREKQSDGKDADGLSLSTT